MIASGLPYEKDFILSELKVMTQLWYHGESTIDQPRRMKTSGTKGK